MLASPRPATPAPPRTRHGADDPVLEAPGASDPLAELGVRAPRLRSQSYRRGVLRIAVSGVPDFGRAIFTVDGGRYARASGRLSLRLRRAPRRVSVLIDVPEVGRTKALTITVKAAAERRAAEEAKAPRLACRILAGWPYRTVPCLAPVRPGTLLLLAVAATLALAGVAPAFAGTLRRALLQRQPGRHTSDAARRRR